MISLPLIAFALFAALMTGVEHAREANEYTIAIHTRRKAVWGPIAAFLGLAGWGTGLVGL